MDQMPAASELPGEPLKKMFVHAYNHLCAFQVCYLAQHVQSVLTGSSKIPLPPSMITLAETENPIKKTFWGADVSTQAINHCTPWNLFLKKGLGCWIVVTRLPKTQDKRTNAGETGAFPGVRILWFEVRWIWVVDMHFKFDREQQQICLPDCKLGASWPSLVGSLEI